MEFGKSKERTQILNECSKNNILESNTVFECFNDRMFTYGIEKNNVYHEFTFQSEDTLLRELSVIDLLNLKRIKYFEHVVFLIDTIGKKEFLSSKVFSSLNDIKMN
jgi:hypothetical protein